MSTGDFKQMVTPCSDPFPMNSDTEPAPAPTPEPCKKNDPVFLTNDPAPTPRTDAQPILDAGYTLVSRDFARTLERELTEARATLLAREGELDSMSAALAAAQQDKERLDWLASQCYYPYDHPQDGVFVVVSENSAPHGAFSLERDGDRKALRAAIDAARSRLPETGKPTP